jgi:glycosyltransferase involved in cell wall biosynthesis
MKTLVISSAKIKNKPVINLLRSAAEKMDISVSSKDKTLSGSFPSGGKMFTGPDSQFLFGLPFIFYAIVLWPIYLIYLSVKKFKDKVEAIVCLNDNEKILLALPAKILGLKNIWLFFPEKTKTGSRTALFLLARLSILATTGCFTTPSMNFLINKGFKKERVFFLPPSADLDYAHQENIFAKIATNSRPHTFFSIGAVVNFSDKTYFESLLKAIDSCQNSIPNIRLIIIGSDSERRNLNWLSQRMGIEKRVWFVGAQDDLIKWFNDFDIYFSLSSEPNLFDLETALLAMSRGVPTAVLRHESFSDIIKDNETGFTFETSNFEGLAEKLKTIEENRKLLKNVGENGKTLTYEKMNRNIQTKAFINLFTI